MPRYIDATELTALLHAASAEATKLGRYTDADVLLRFIQILDIQPAADVVEVVRCDHCRFYDKGICKLHSDEPDEYGSGFYMEMQETDFCSYGKRKEQT